MTPPIEHTYVCAKCSHAHEVEPLKCQKCGCERVVRVGVDTGGGRGLSVGVDVKERKR